MESEEITKLVDGVYKNILEKFNPGARQLITAGKSYLKALHGAASASRLFNETLAKIAMNAQQSGTNDIGAGLLNVVSVHKEIQEQQMNILKAFYVDLLVPLETNLEKDTKVVQHEQKKFLQQHKVRMESYHKAMATMKKQRKKKISPENTEKELRSLQVLEDQKKKLDAFCEQSYKNALTQERRRYGFVLERQCSIAKHWMAYHATGKEAIDNSLSGWEEIAASREVMPPTVYESNYSKRAERMKEDTSASHSGATQLKKSRSVDAPYGDMRTLHENGNHNSRNFDYAENTLPRAKSDFNLTSASPQNENWDQRPVVKALYAYMPSGENQLSFEEDDKIALVGHKAKGWQFGENLRTQIFGWFPIAYTNTVDNESKFVERDQSCYENVKFQRNRSSHVDKEYTTESFGDCDIMESDLNYRRRNNSTEESSPTRMFGDTINLRNQKKYRGISNTNPRPGPPPTLPAPIPSAPHSNRMLNSSQSFCSSNGVPTLERRANKNQTGLQASHKQTTAANHFNKGSKQPAPKTSLHSSNDSGFANEPPPQPEVDYSDEENSNRVPIRRRAGNNTHNSREAATSWTLNRNFRSSVDGQIDEKAFNSMYRKSGKYDTMIASDDEILQSSNGSSIKRTKSFWKFGRNDDSILAGMSLWRHRDLVTSPKVNEIRKTQATKSSSQGSVDQDDDDDNVQSNCNTLTRANSNYLNNASKKRKDSVTSMEMFEDNENIYGIKENPLPKERPVTSSPMRTNFTPKSRMKIMKTIEIDIENHNDNEHIIRNDEKHFQKESMQQQQQQQQQPTSRNSKEQEQQKKQNSMKPRNASKDNNGTTNNTSKKSNMEKLKSNHNAGKAQAQQIEQQQQQQQQKQSINPMELLHSTEDEDESDNGTLKMSDVNNFFDDMPQNSAGVIMKTVKRKDILKQYYTSEEESDDAEIKSTSSDPYDCIVINDHLARREEKQRRQIHNSYQEHQMEFQTFRATSSPASTKVKSTNGKTKSGNSSKYRQDAENDRYNSNTLTRISTGNSAMSTPTATILPRTRLMKSNNANSLTLERNREQKKFRDDKNSNSDIVSDKEIHLSKTYGPWYDFWDPQLQQTSNSKSENNFK